LNPNEIERFLGELLAAPLPPDELEELVRQVAAQEELVARVRALALEEVELALPLSLEARP
jgi:hypothetical protein